MPSPPGALGPVWAIAADLLLETRRLKETALPPMEDRFVNGA